MAPKETQTVCAQHQDVGDSHCAGSAASECETQGAAASRCHVSRKCVSAHLFLQRGFPGFGINATPPRNVQL